MEIYFFFLKMGILINNSQSVSGQDSFSFNEMQKCAAYLDQLQQIYPNTVKCPVGPEGDMNGGERLASFRGLGWKRCHSVFSI